MFASGPTGKSRNIRLVSGTADELVAPPTEAVPEPPETEAVPPDAIPDPVEQIEQPVYQPYFYYRRLPQMTERWFGVDTLMWWTPKVDLPALVTTSPQGTSATEAGILGTPGTQTIWGGDHVFNFAQAGVRFRGGSWFEQDDGSGIGAELVMLGNRGQIFVTQSDGDPILARPFLDTDTGLQNSQLVAYPGLNAGSIGFDTETRMYSINMHYWVELYDASESDGTIFRGQSSNFQSEADRPEETLFGLQIGPRFTHLDDTLLMDERFISQPSGRSYLLRDSFKTENSFLGGEFGFRMRRRGRIDIDLGLILAIGANHRELDINGQNVVTDGGSSVTNPGGFLAQQSNFGGWDDNRFSLMPSLDVSFGYENENGWRLSVGYSLLYWTNVLRAGEQISLSIDPNQLLNPPPGVSTNPAPLYREADYFAHGLTVGISKSW